MKKICGIVALGAVCTLWALAQEAPGPQAQLPAAVLRVTTRLVLVHVVVTDKQRRPVTDLTLQDFILQENGKRQKIAVFSLEQLARRVREQPAPPPLPPHVYTNRPEYRKPAGLLTVLLLDLLNTPVRDQAYAHAQLLRYLSTQLRSGHRIAVLALTSKMFLLQDFTSDPELLRAAVDSLQLYKSKDLALSEPLRAQISSDDPLMDNAGFREFVQRVQVEQEVVGTTNRVQSTLAAMEAIARGLAGFPGRKNLVWISAAFPLTLDPNVKISPAVYLSDPNAPMEEMEREFTRYRNYGRQLRRVANLLTDAQVAVYPVDARGLVGDPLMDVSDSHRSPTGQVDSGFGLSDRFNDTRTRLLSSKQAMVKLAEDTGGRAFTNRNDIDAAVALSVADGSTYYTLGYHPEKKNWDGKFRRLEVKLTRKGLRVRHRRGYYATDPAKWRKQIKKKNADLLAALRSPLPATAVTFRARVIPPQPAKKARVPVEFLVDADTLAFEQVGEGRQHCNVEFLVAAISPEGKVAASAGRSIDARLRPENYQRVQERGLPFKTQLKLESGRYQLRLLVRDNRTGLLGTTDVPLVLQEPKPAAPHKPK